MARKTEIPAHKGMTCHEIAEKYGTTYKTARMRMVRSGAMPIQVVNVPDSRGAGHPTTCFAVRDVQAEFKTGVRKMGASFGMKARKVKND